MRARSPLRRGRDGPSTSQTGLAPAAAAAPQTSRTRTASTDTVASDENDDDTRPALAYASALALERAASPAVAPNSRGAANTPADPTSTAWLLGDLDATRRRYLTAPVDGRTHPPPAVSGQQQQRQQQPTPVARAAQQVSGPVRGTSLVMQNGPPLRRRPSLPCMVPETPPSQGMPSTATSLSRRSGSPAAPPSASLPYVPPYPAPPLIWSQAHMRALMERGVSAAMPFQGSSAVLGVRSVNVDVPPELPGKEAVAVRPGTAAALPVPVTVTCASGLFGVPNLAESTRAAQAHLDAAAAAAAAMDSLDDRTAVEMPPHQSSKGVRQSWRRVMLTAHDRRALAFTLVLLLVLPALYYGFLAPTVWATLSPAPVIIALWLHVTALASLFMTSFSDPGTVPRFTHLYFDTSSGGASMVSMSTTAPPRMLDADPLDLDHNGLPFQIKYCQTCKVSRGPRTFHCSTCDNCISGHDHHCPYTSNCIGAANYKYFVTFLTHAMFLDLMVIGSSIAALAVHATDLGTGAASALRALPMAGVLTVIAALISMSLIPLTTYHWTLLARNMTTHEHVRYGVDDTWRNPWARRGWTAWIRNAVWVLCRPLPPQAVKWYLPHRVFEHQHQHQRLSRTAVAE